jgi:hypothetical protein
LLLLFSPWARFLDVNASKIYKTAQQQQQQQQQFNSILIYLCANSTAQGPITKLARVNESK